MSRRVIEDKLEINKIKLRELKHSDLKYIQNELVSHYKLYSNIYNFLVRNDDRDLPGRLKKSIQSIVVYYCLERDENYYNLTIDIDFDEICYIEDILKRVILEIDNSLVKKEYKLKEFQYKYYKEPLLMGKKFISKEDKVNVFYNPIDLTEFKKKI